MITIKDEALGSIYLEHDFHGFRVKDSENKQPTEVLFKNADVNLVLADAAKRLIAKLEGTYTLAGFQSKVNEIHQELMKAMQLSELNVVQESAN